MTTNRLFLILFFLIGIQASSLAQVKPKLQYSIGAGGSHDGANMLYGINFTNELNYRLGKRTSLNAGLLFYQSIGGLEKNEFAPGQRNLDNSSGFFITPSFKYNLIQRPSGFNLSFALGPTLQIGGEGYMANINYFNPESGPELVNFIDNYQRIGIFAELEAEWKTKNPNVRNAASISASGFDSYLQWYINATYKVRFGLGKK
ncbi:hypothetical protein [Algoriphagus sp. AK58]|uniref:hypothetical protein n=1 Tax=Algoriphagus sp. AK58 TaxID=1406877 RepID=UPI00164F699F|nr:hypothetical protein [Algoriphagus sp. AK58]MBC6368794.1 hypothetical protein [Algoriphagus sp. AK58]